MLPHPGDVGGWFRTATGTGVTLLRGWEPAEAGFGRVSPPEEVAAGFALLRDRPVAVLTGAGMSTGSGLPDYRGRDAVARTPMTFQEFIRNDLARRRYWARSTVGWPWFTAAKPGVAHHALARLAKATSIIGVVTQNVDGLHQAAGSSPVVELHGALADVVCLGCRLRLDRQSFQATLLRLNPAIVARMEQLSEQARTAPDGDAEVDRTDSFVYLDCPSCGGLLKPDVVFFGENARPETVARARAVVDQAEILVVLGSSLTVMSGLRFVRRTAKTGKPIVIAGDGATRGDSLATIRLHGRLEDLLTRWVELASG